MPFSPSRIHSRVSLCLTLLFPWALRRVSVRAVTMNAGDMLVAAPGRWDEACFAVPAVRALIASGQRVGVLCEQAQREFWETVAGLTVIDFPAKAKAKAVAARIAGSWLASLAWEVGMAAEAFQIAAIPRRFGADERKLKKRLTHPLDFSAGPLVHRVR